MRSVRPKNAVIDFNFIRIAIKMSPSVYLKTLIAMAIIYIAWLIQLPTCHKNDMSQKKNNFEHLHCADIVITSGYK